MKILITGAKGFVGRNLVENLKCIMDGRNKTRNVSISSIYEVDIDTTSEELKEYCKDCDFVFHLAGVNRPQNEEEFMNGNFGFTLAYGGNKSVLANRCNVGIAACICNVQISHFIGQGRLDLAGKIGGNSCLGYIKLNGVVGCIGYAHVSRNL